MARSWAAAAAWLVCPRCGQGLRPSPTGQALTCPTGHSFDVAAAGYVNLLLANRRLPPAVGDDPAMLRARRRFLDGGHYRPLAEALGRLTEEGLAGWPASGLPDLPGPAILDVGCGEGSYLGQLQRGLTETIAGQPVYRFGMDVAKTAVAMASRRDDAGHFVVADARRGLPFRAAAFQVVLSVFAPRPPAELRRVVAPGGRLLVAVPTPDHLRELRATVPLLGIEPEKERRLVERLAGGFRLARRVTLEYELTLSDAEVTDLVGMTPSARHLPPTAGWPVGAAGGKVTAGFAVFSFVPV
jgi:23S rRNA (guanine745-N1)-methyltransferase